MPNVTLRDIKEAVENMLITAFPAVTVHKGNLINGFPRPSFHTQIDNVTRDDRLYVSERGMTIRIHYFPPDRYQYEFDNMEVQQTLELTFRLNFKVGDRTFTIDENRSQVVDGVLEFEFDFEFVESTIADDAAEKMEELEVKNV